LAASSTGAGTASYHKSFLPAFGTAAGAAKCIYHIPVLTMNIFNYEYLPINLKINIS
jgi:hypothetical protein